MEYAAENNIDRTAVMTVSGAADCMVDYSAMSRKDVSMYSLFDEIAKDAKAEDKQYRKSRRKKQKET